MVVWLFEGRRSTRMSDRVGRCWPASVFPTSHSPVRYDRRRSRATCHTPRAWPPLWTAATSLRPGTGSGRQPDRLGRRTSGTVRRRRRSVRGHTDRRRYFIGVLWTTSRTWWVATTIGWSRSPSAARHRCQRSHHETRTPSSVCSHKRR